MKGTQLQSWRGLFKNKRSKKRTLQEETCRITEMRFEELARIDTVAFGSANLWIIRNSNSIRVLFFVIYCFHELANRLKVRRAYSRNKKIHVKKRGHVSNSGVTWFEVLARIDIDSVESVQLSPSRDSQLNWATGSPGLKVPLSPLRVTYGDSQEQLRCYWTGHSGSQKKFWGVPDLDQSNWFNWFLRKPIELNWIDPIGPPIDSTAIDSIAAVQQLNQSRKLVKSYFQ